MRTRAGVWVDNTDVQAHIAARKRARKAPQRHNSAAVFKGMNDLIPTLGRIHRRNHKYRAEEPARASAWSAGIIEEWLNAEPGDIAATIAGVLRRNSIRSLNEDIQCKQAAGAEAIEIMIHNLGEDVDPVEDI